MFELNERSVDQRLEPEWHLQNFNRHVVVSMQMKWLCFSFVYKFRLYRIRIDC